LPVYQSRHVRRHHTIQEGNLMSVTSDAATSTTVTSPRLQAFLAQPQRLFIGGQWVESSSGKAFPTYDPSTGKNLAEVAHCTAADNDAAVAAAKQAFDEGSWVRKRTNTREELLFAISQKIQAWADDFAVFEALDNGKPMSIAAAFDVRSAADCFRYYAGW